MVKVLRILSFLILLLVLYPVLHLLWSTITDFKPENTTPLVASKKLSNKTIDRDTLSFYSWNIGYCGLGAQSNFFYDSDTELLPKGKMVRSPKHLVDLYQKGVKETVASLNVDFILLQEVDINSTRSYYTNEYDFIKEALDEHTSVFAKNYDVSRVPVPYLTPWDVIGKVHSGLGSFSKYFPVESVRKTLPGEYAWPVKVFHLDRCMIYQRFQTNNGPDLVVINTHFSAYDTGGFMKKQQLQFLIEVVENEYKKGNYVVVGGDWNQTPKELEIGEKLKDWKLAYEPNKTTVRSNVDEYKKGQTKEKLIDYFLVSPNVKILNSQTEKMDFVYSDHEPVKIEISLISKTD